MDGVHLGGDDDQLDQRRHEAGDAGPRHAQGRHGANPEDEGVAEHSREDDGGDGRGEGTAGVAGRALQPGEDRDEHGRHSGEGREAEVRRPHVRHAGRGADQPQEVLGGEQGAERGEGHQGPTQHEGGGDDAAGLVLPAAPVGARNEDRHRRAHPAQGQHGDDREAVGEADRRDGGGPQGAYDDLADDVDDQGEDELRTDGQGDAGDLAARRGDTAGSDGGRDTGGAAFVTTWRVRTRGAHDEAGRPMPVTPFYGDRWAQTTAPDPRNWTG